MFDLSQEKRNYNIFCEYWCRDTDVDLPNRIELINLKRVATGAFWAKRLGTHTKREDFFGSNMMHPQESMQIETRDFVQKLSAEDVIKINGEFWRVVNSQSYPTYPQQNDFCAPNAVSHTTIIEIRK